MPKIKTEKNRSLESDSMWVRDNRFSAIVIPILMIIIISLVVGLGWYMMQDKDSQLEITSVKQEFETCKKDFQEEIDGLQKKIDEMQGVIDGKKEEEEKAAAENEKGFIEGSLSYPSNYIPKDMSVCAINLTTEKEYCTSEQIYDPKYTYTVGYKIEVPAGSYNVYATVPAQKDYKAYYSQYVNCGLKYNCTSHTPLEVKVEKDQTTSNIDPIDWYIK